MTLPCQKAFPLYPLSPRSIFPPYRKGVSQPVQSRQLLYGHIKLLMFIFPVYRRFVFDLPGLSRTFLQRLPSVFLARLPDMVIIAVVCNPEQPCGKTRMTLKTFEREICLQQRFCARSSARKPSPPHRPRRNLLKDSCSADTASMNCCLVIY